MDSLVIKILGGPFNGLTQNSYGWVTASTFVIVFALIFAAISIKKINRIRIIVATVLVVLAGILMYSIIKYEPKAEIINTKNGTRVTVDKLTDAIKIKRAYKEKYEKQDEEIDVDKYIEELNK